MSGVFETRSRATGNRDGGPTGRLRRARRVCSWFVLGTLCAGAGTMIDSGLKLGWTFSVQASNKVEKFCYQRRPREGEAALQAVELAEQSTTLCSRLRSRA